MVAIPRLCLFDEAVTSTAMEELARLTRFRSLALEDLLTVLKRDIILRQGTVSARANSFDLIGYQAWIINGTTRGHLIRALNDAHGYPSLIRDLFHPQLGRRAAYLIAGLCTEPDDAPVQTLVELGVIEGLEHILIAQNNLVHTQGLGCEEEMAALEELAHYPLARARITATLIPHLVTRLHRGGWAAPVVTILRDNMRAVAIALDEGIDRCVFRHQVLWNLLKQMTHRWRISRRRAVLLRWAADH